MKRHVVVTGAGGFIGGRVARWLAAHDFSVTAVTRRPGALADGDPAALHWVQGDLLGSDQVLPARFDAIVHCAAELPSRCQDRELLYTRNLVAAQKVFERARDAAARVAVFLSSMSVYGTVTVPLVTEDTSPQDPDPYGRAKRDAELLLEKAVAKGFPSGLAIRLPGTVGRGSHNNFLSVALASVLRGDVVQANNRDALFNNIVYVGDLATFVGGWLVNPRRGFSLTNLAARDPMRIHEIVDMLFEGAGRPRRVDFTDGGKAPFLISLDRAVSLGYSAASVRGSVEAFVRDSASARGGFSGAPRTGER